MRVPKSIVPAVLCALSLCSCKRREIVEPLVREVKVVEYSIHEVQKNDSLWKIATQWYGDGAKWILIYEANQDTLGSLDSLKVGQKLKIPKISDE